MVDSLLRPGQFEISDRQKTTYFSAFAQKHHSAFMPHRFSGTVGWDVEEDWRKVAKHCLVAGVYADILSDELGLPEDRRNKIVRAGIMHDWDKPYEISTINAALKNGGLSLQILEDIRRRDVRLLEIMGEDSEVIALTAANTPHTAAGPQTVDEKIIWYTDAMLSGTMPMPICERFANLERGWTGKIEDPMRAQRSLALSEAYRPLYDGRAAFDVQRELGDKIGGELATQIRFGGESRFLPYFLEQLLEQRISR